MTVAACILAASPGSALADVEGRPNVRRIVETAWAGGALPVVVVAPDPEGAVAASLAGSPAVLGTPAPVEHGPIGQICRAIDIACAEVDGTSAALVLPARFGWVDAETMTSLIEAHGVDPDRVIRPTFRGEPGWPLLVPIVHLGKFRALPADAMPDALAASLISGAPSRTLDLGDPGVTHPIDVARADLPAFDGPPEPSVELQHEWGSPAAAEPETPPAPPRIVDQG